MHCRTVRRCQQIELVGTMAAAVAAIRPVTNAGHRRRAGRRDIVRRTAPQRLVDYRRLARARERRQRCLVACRWQARGAIAIVAAQAVRCKSLALAGGKGIRARRGLRIARCTVVDVPGSHRAARMATLVVADQAVGLYGVRGTARDVRAQPVELGRDDVPGALHLVVTLLAREVVVNADETVVVLLPDGSVAAALLRW